MSAVDVERGVRGEGVLEGLRRLGNGLYGITEVILNPRGKGRSNQISSWNRIAIVRRKAMSISLKFVKSNLVLAAIHTKKTKQIAIV